MPRLILVWLHSICLSERLAIDFTEQVAFPNIEIEEFDFNTINIKFKKAKHTKYSEKRTFLTRWYAHVRRG